MTSHLVVTSTDSHSLHIVVNVQVSFLSLWSLKLGNRYSCSHVHVLKHPPADFAIHYNTYVLQKSNQMWRHTFHAYFCLRATGLFPVKNALCLAICLIVQTICPDNVGVSNLWNGLWSGLMEWTDGMECQLTKIHHRGYGEVVAIAHFNWTVMSSLFSSLVPRPMRRMFSMWKRHVRICSFNYHSSRNNRTTGSLLAGSASWPFRIMQQFWSSPYGNKGRVRSYPPPCTHR